jgi:hypothetical protein
MTATEHHEPVGLALALLDAAHRQALENARAHPDSTWIDAASAIGATQAQLLAAPGRGAVGPDAEVPTAGSCLRLLEAAEHALEQIPAGDGPVNLALVRSYLTEAIIETSRIET